MHRLASKSLRFGLVLASAFALGCPKPQPEPDGGSGDSLDASIPSCDLTSDTDVMTRTYALSTLAIPTSNTVGFDVDGLNTTASGDVGGCRRVDGQPGGVDNALAQIIAGLGDVLSEAGVDINEELQRALESDALDIDVTIDHWNGTATDTCVGVAITGASGGEPIDALQGSARLDAGVVVVAFDGSLTIAPTFLLSADGGLGTCTEGCTEVELPITIQGARAQLVFGGGAVGMDALVVEATPTRTGSTYLGGYVRYTGEDAIAFRPGLAALVETIDSGLVSTVDTIFGTYLDLDSTPSLSACASAGGTMTTADTFSAAILASGSASP